MMFLALSVFFNIFLSDKPLLRCSYIEEHINIEKGDESKIKLSVIRKKAITCYSFDYYNNKVFVGEEDKKAIKIKNGENKCTIKIIHCTYYPNENCNNQIFSKESLESKKFDNNIVNELTNEKKEVLELGGNGFFLFAGLKIEPIYSITAVDYDDRLFFDDLKNFFAKMNTQDGYSEYSLENIYKKNNISQKTSYLNSQFEGYYIETKDYDQKEEDEENIVKIFMTKYGVFFPDYNLLSYSKYVESACKAFVNIFLYPDFVFDLAGNFATSMIKNSIVVISLHFKKLKIYGNLHMKNKNPYFLYKLDIKKHNDNKDFKTSMINILKKANKYYTNTVRIIEEIENLKDNPVKEYEC